MIPCKDCLVLAVCKNKEEISCPILFNWMNTAGYTFTDTLKYLPNWKTILIHEDQDLYIKTEVYEWDKYFFTLQER